MGRALGSSPITIFCLDLAEATRYKWRMRRACKQGTASQEGKSVRSCKGAAARATRETDVLSGASVFSPVRACLGRGIDG